MLKFITVRFIQAALTIFGVLVVAFVLVRLAGDPVVLLLPAESTPEDAAAMRAELGLDRPLWEQFWNFLIKAAQGDFGNSLRQATPALELVFERLPATLELAFAAFGLGIVLAVVTGTLVQLSGSTRLRNAVMWLAFVRQAIPIFWFGLLLILVFSVTMGLFPALGRGGVQHLILPALTLATYELALYLRLFNAEFGEQSKHDYVRTAYAKGQSRSGVIVRQIIPNTLLPIITIAGINLGVLLGGTIVTEIVFSWPGVGRLIVQSVSQRDYPVIQAGLLVVATVFVLMNFIVDILYSVLDPRVRLS